jgi:phage protein D
LSFVTDTIEKLAGTLTEGTSLAYRVWCEVSYTPKGSNESKDISEEISKYLLSLDYTDTIEGQADDLTLTLEDRAQLWSDSWYPQRGSKLTVTIYTLNRSSLTEGLKSLTLGSFEIDEIELKMAPAVVQIKAVAVTSEGSLRGEKKNRTWEKITVKKCCEDIAKENGLTFDWYCEDDPPLDHVEQSDESDLEFLQKVVKDAGLCLKVDLKKLTVFDEQQQEKGEAKIFFLHPGTETLAQTTQTENAETMYVYKFTDYQLKAKTRDVYKACHVKYKKGKDKAVIEATFTDPNKKDGQTLEASEQCDTVAEAERLAKKKLREKNKDEVTASFNLYGDTIYAAGELVQLQHFGVFDGKYIITQVALKLGGGFTASLDMRRCLDGY